MSEEIIEINIGSHIVMVSSNPCPKCGQERQNIMMYGNVCFNRDSPSAEPEQQKNMLPNLETSTAQEVFDYVVSHLRKQKQVSMAENKLCKYSYNGLKCAAGCLIPDELYKPEIEGKNWGQSIHMINMPSAHELLISRLQQIHDHRALEDWETQFNRLAQAFNLDYTSPPATTA